MGEVCDEVYQISHDSSRAIELVDGALSFQLEWRSLEISTQYFRVFDKSRQHQRKPANIHQQIPNISTRWAPYDRYTWNSKSLSMAENKWITEIQKPLSSKYFFNPPKKKTLAGGPIAWNVSAASNVSVVVEAHPVEKYATVKLGSISPSEEVTIKQKLKPPSSKVSSGSYWGWNGLHDTRCASTELLELASSNFRFMVLREGCPLSPLYPGNALSPENWKAILGNASSWSWLVKWTWMNNKPQQKRNGQVQSYVAGFCCFIPKKTVFGQVDSSGVSLLLNRTFTTSSNYHSTLTGDVLFTCVSIQQLGQQYFRSLTLVDNNNLPSQQSSHVVLCKRNPTSSFT